MKKKTKRALVTGGSGFIGKHLINSLQSRGYKVSSLDKISKGLPKGARSIIGDVCDRKAVAMAMKDQDIVYHLAGVLGTSELQYVAIEATEINVIGSLHVFDEAVKNKTKVVLISKLNPWLNTYSITKEMAEKFCMMYQKDFGMRATIVKWFSLYGPGQKHYGVQKAVPTFIVKALQGEPLPIFGDGKQLADFIYVTDAVEACVAVSENPKSDGRVVQIGTGRGTSVNILAKMIIKLADSKSKLDHLRMRIGEDPNARVVADLTELYKLTSFRPKVKLPEGLIETIAYYRELLAQGEVRRV